MNGRDLLRMIGIGGVGAVASVVSGKEAEAREPLGREVIGNVIRDNSKAETDLPEMESLVKYMNAMYGGDE